MPGWMDRYRKDIGATKSPPRQPSIVISPSATPAEHGRRRGGRSPADKSGGRAGIPCRKWSRLRAPCRRSRCQSELLRNDDGHQHTPVRVSTPRLNDAPGGSPGIGSRAKTRLRAEPDGLTWTTRQQLSTRFEPGPRRPTLIKAYPHAVPLRAQARPLMPTQQQQHRQSLVSTKP